MIGVVLAGGPGERLRPLTKEKPKAFLKLAGKLLLEYAVDELRKAGIDDIIVVVPPRWSRGVPVEDVTVVNQEVEGSLRSAFEVSLRKVERIGRYREAVFTFVGFLSAPKGMVRSTLDFYSTSGYPVVISSVPVLSGLETYGFVKLKGSRVERFVPPFRGRREGAGYVFGGVLVGNVDTLRILSQTDYYDALSELSQRGLLGGIVWHGEWLEIGYPWDLLEALNVVKRIMAPKIDFEAKVSRDAVIEGSVIVEKGVRILSGAVIEGPSYIGKGTVIGRNSIVVSSIIEEGSFIGDCAKIEKSIVMEGSVIGDHSLVSHSILGENSRVMPYGFTEVGEPEEVPERLRNYVRFTRRPPSLGAVLGPRTVLNSFTKTRPGEVID